MTEILFIIYWILKSFYITSSGSMQPADYVFVASFMCYFIRWCKTRNTDNKYLFDKKDKYFMWFLLFVIIINLSYSLIYFNTSFHKAILYFIFNVLVIIEFRGISKSQKFISIFLYSTFFAIFIQFGIYIIGAGSYLGSRYQGTFNDPNQFAFFIISRFFICFYIVIYGLRRNIYLIFFLLLSFFISLYLIILSASTGMFISFLLFCAFFLIKTIIEKKKTLVKIIPFILFVLLLLIYLNGTSDTLSSLGLDAIISRIEYKFDKSSNSFIIYINDRCLQPVLYHPYYCLFGSGEGNMSRFISTGNGSHEIHATSIGLLFYYGAIPYYFIIKWVISNFKKIDTTSFIMYLAIFIESFTLANHRQSSLWILLILPSLFNKGDASNEKNQYT